MKIQVVMENYMEGKDISAEHGLCIYVETKEHKLLVDTGQSNQTWKNAKALGIDLVSIDTVVLSHGHYDHSGGLLTFAKTHPFVHIYMRENAGGDYYSKREEGMHYIGIDKEILTLPNLHLISEDCSIDSELSLFTNVTGRNLFPKGNKRLFQKIGKDFVEDDFSHEQYLVIQKEEGDYVLISGCAHNGILNILERFESIYHCNPSLVISGFHMVQKEYTEEDIENIKKTAELLKEMNTRFCTGHCTGELAYCWMKEIMGERLFEIKNLSIEI
ncbi:MAG: MBL fold metallo-hydrolase [Agathobacter sp.]|nr:MBL fold metallo-hydrolase [Agathobacter sp.]